MGTPVTGWLTVAATADALGISPALVVAAAETGHLPGRELRRSVWLIESGAVAEILARIAGELPRVGAAL